MTRAQPHNSTNGFSLIELIIALGILSLLSVAVLSGQLGFSKAFAKLNADVDARRSVRSFESVFAQDMRAATGVTRQNAMTLRFELADGSRIDYLFSNPGHGKPGQLKRKTAQAEYVLFDRVQEWSFETPTTASSCRISLTIEYPRLGKKNGQIEVDRQVAPRTQR